MSDAPDDRAVIIECSLELIGEALQLPPNVKVRRIVEKLNTPNTVYLLLDGAGLPDQFKVHPYGVIRKARPVIHATYVGGNQKIVKWTWDDPPAYQESEVWG